ncbi:MAG: hypothetical protein ACK55Z_22080 [bacterium]
MDVDKRSPYTAVAAYELAHVAAEQCAYSRAVHSVAIDRTLLQPHRCSIWDGPGTKRPPQHTALCDRVGHIVACLGVDAGPLDGYDGCALRNPTVYDVHHLRQLFIASLHLVRIQCAGVVLVVQHKTYCLAWVNADDLHRLPPLRFGTP